MSGKKIVSWEAEEYVQHDRNASWYVGLVLISLAFGALAVLAQQWSFLVLIVVIVVTLVVYTTRPPRKLKYQLTTDELIEDNRTFVLADYKSFGLIKDAGQYAVVLTPRKRFSGVVTVFFPEDKGEVIVDAFGAKLPMEEVKLDFIDKIVRMLRI